MSEKNEKNEKNERGHASRRPPQPSPRAQAPGPRMDSPVRHPSRRGAHRRRPRHGEGRGVAVVALLLVAAIVGGGAWMWLNRTVRVVVNGAPVDVRIDSGLRDVMSAAGAAPVPGDLVSVAGNVIREGGGVPFTARVNGRELGEGQIESFRAQGNEAITFGDGTDVTEPSHQEEREVQPRLVPAGGLGAVTFVSQYGRPGRQMFTVGDVSGEAVGGEVLEPVQDVQLTSVNVRPEGGRRVVALTFDDGPSAYTQRYLDILSKYGARATFFCLGSQIPGREDLVRAIRDQGSQVASHTQNHRELTALGPDELRPEVTDAFSAISSAGGGDTTVMRPPYGALGAEAWVASGGTFSASVIWNLDSLDWERPGVDAIVENSTRGISSGDIVLMHDGGGNRDQNLEALPKIIERLQAEGYELVTIDELLATDSRIPRDVASGNARIPEGCVWATEVA